MSAKLYLLHAAGLQKVVLDCGQKVLELQAALAKAIADEDYDRATQLHHDVTRVKSELKEVRMVQLQVVAVAAQQLWVGSLC